MNFSNMTKLKQSQRFKKFKVLNNIGKGEELESWLNLFLILLYMLFTIKYVQFKQYTGNFLKIKTKCNQKQIKY